jgi:uncharacterized membrane protein YbhN (UPF0104 family)
MGEPKSTSSRIFLLIRIAVVLGCIAGAVVWLTREGRYIKVAGIFGQMNLWLFAAVFAGYVITQALMAVRWWLLMRSQSVFVGLWPAVRLIFLGLFYNNFLPGAVGGDLVRAWYVTRHTEKRFEAALSVVMDRVIGLVGTVIMAVFCDLVFLRGELGVIRRLGGAFGRYKWAGMWFIIGAAAICGLALLTRPGRRVWAFAYDHGVRLMKKLVTATILYCRSPLTVASAFLLTFLLQGIAVAGFWLLGRDMGIAAGAKYYFVFFPLTWVVGAVPVSIGGAGVVEGGLLWLFTALAHVQSEKAFAIALLQRIVWMLTSLPGAGIHLAGAHLPKEFSIDADVPLN